ncbi:MAG: molecular chaperone HtpG, partial [Anaerolineaceae bacterium]|nr:molecular chaperone HtpG [Anaerolineaceae bacterium]
NFTIEPAEMTERGTVVEVQLKEDAAEFAQEYRLREVIKKHSNYIPFPIYLGEKNEQVNQKTALWRESPRQVSEKQHHDFYQQLTLDIEPPLSYLHLSIDAPVQLYAVLYLPASGERNVFSLRKQDGLMLYARKVLIQEYTLDLLPEFLRFMQGVVDSEDLPLNVSRESVQSNRVMAQLKKVITSKVIDHLKSLANDKPEEYIRFWKEYQRAIKQGIATDPDYWQALLPLLRFHSLKHPDSYIALDDYLKEMKLGQEKIYYLLGDDDRSIAGSPHLEMFAHQGYDVLFLTDPMDPFMLLRLNQYQEKDLVNAATRAADLPATEQDEKEESTEDRPRLSEADTNAVIERFKQQLGDKISDVHITQRLVESPARLVDPEGALNTEMQRVYRLLNKDFEVPQKVLEINPQHELIRKLSALPEENVLSAAIIEQIYEDALLIEGLHPDPASMIARIQSIMKAALD